jgi:hypothetical protein
MIEDLPWAEFASDPDKYIKELEETEEATQKDLHRVRQELRLMRQIKKQKDTAEEWKHNGIPEQRTKHEPDDDEVGEEVGVTDSNGRPLTRKQRIRSLMAQDPARQWKVNEIAQALADPNTKSVRVSMDELAHAGSIVKHPGAIYQYTTAAQHAF